MKEKITNNLLLKILSLIIAFLVWLIVVNAENRSWFPMYSF